LIDEFISNIFFKVNFTPSFFSNAPTMTPEGNLITRDGDQIIEVRLFTFGFLNPPFHVTASQCRDPFLFYFI
jgi:hypothetical protein